MITGIDNASLQAIREGRPFRSTWLTGYRTKGGTYIIASPAAGTDSGKPRDLAAVLPGDIGSGRVVPLYVAANPEWLATLAAALEE